MNHFLRGCLFMVGVESLSQDIYGLEGYIQKVRDGWVSGYITVPVAIIFICVSLGWYLLPKVNSDDPS